MEKYCQAIPENDPDKSEFTQRIVKKIQDAVERCIEKFDQKLEELFKERLSTEVEIHSLDAQYLHLKNELVILQQYEDKEDTLNEKLLDAVNILSELGNF